MKRLKFKFKTILFVLGFALLTGLVTAGATASNPVPLDRNYSFFYDTGDGDDDDTTDGGIRYPGPGH
ncbi:MAG: hypothetical protein IT281_09635 [Ignavibacteria bacterium]|nr:hypothetical protein [Ignavibacteria bacterium]